MKLKLLPSLLLLQIAGYAMPVEDGMTHTGVWANFVQVLNTAANTSEQINQGYQQINGIYQQVKNFDLANTNNMSDMFSKMGSASKLGESITYTTDDGINKINDWTRTQENPEGRLSAIQGVMDTAKASLAVAREQSKFLEQESQDVLSINRASQTVEGQTQAIQAGNQLMTHMNTQMQSVNHTLAQQSALRAAEAAQRAAKTKLAAEQETTIAKALNDIGEEKYEGQSSVPTNAF